MNIRRFFSILSSAWVMCLLGLIGAIVPNFGESHNFSIYGFIGGFCLGYLVVSVANNLTKDKLLPATEITPQQLVMDASPVGFLSAFTLAGTAVYINQFQILLIGIATLLITTLLVFWAVLSSRASE